MQEQTLRTFWTSETDFLAAVSVCRCTESYVHTVSIFLLKINAVCSNICRVLENAFFPEACGIKAWSIDWSALNINACVRLVTIEEANAEAFQPLILV